MRSRPTSSWRSAFWSRASWNDSKPSATATPSHSGNTCPIMLPRSTSSASASPSVPLIFLRINENEINIQHPSSKLQRSASKIQDPRSKIQRSFKLQAPKRAAAAALGIWILEVPWILDFGSWIFGTRIFGTRHRPRHHPHPPRHHHLPGHYLAGCDERSEEHTSELQSPCNLVCRLLLEKKKKI